MKNSTISYNIPISSSTTSHFVDGDDMERVHSHSDVECILTTMLHQVLEYKNDIRTILKHFITRDLPC